MKTCKICKHFVDVISNPKLRGSLDDEMVLWTQLCAMSAWFSTQVERTAYAGHERISEEIGNVVE